MNACRQSLFCAMTPAWLLLAALAVPAHAAEPTVMISSVEPIAGDTSGGTVVTITGSGFTTCVICSPPVYPTVWFGDTQAASVHLQGGLIATTPPHTPGPVDVRVVQWDGSSEDVLRDGFTFVVEGSPQQHERVLLPILLPPIVGAYGSDFRTSLTAANVSDLAAHIYGLEPSCLVRPCAPWNQNLPYSLGPNEELDSGDVAATGNPGRFLYIPKAHVDRLAMNLRVYDVSRDSENFGTELPIVRADRFRGRFLVLTGVPSDPRFRNTLRIYATEAITVIVTTAAEQRVVTLTPGANIFDPAYAQIADLQLGGGLSDVTIQRTWCNDIPCLPADEHGFWAIISVTNNETQMITTITPQP